MEHQLIDHLGGVLRAHKAGRRVGIASVCSAHPLVLAAACPRGPGRPAACCSSRRRRTRSTSSAATPACKPAGFRDLVHRIAGEEGLPARARRARRRPPRAQHVAARAGADGHAEGGGARARPTRPPATRRSTSTAACRWRTTPCPWPTTVVAERAPRGCSPRRRPPRRDPSAVRYVIGTEVPVPGGAHETIDALAPTPPDAARATLAAHRGGLRGGRASTRVWPRIMALVVQPGVEFDHVRVFDYDPARTADLQHVLDDEPDMVFEAHSTDYQLTEGLTALVERPLGGAQGRPGAHLRAARGPLRPRGDRGPARARRTDRSRPPRGDRGRDARRPGALGALLRGHRGRAAHRPALQLQRPDALLPPGPADRGGGRAAAREPRRAPGSRSPC